MNISIYTRFTVVFCSTVALSWTNAFSQAIEWDQPTDGFWGTASNWANGLIPDSEFENAVFGLEGAYRVTSINDLILGGFSILNPDVILILDPPFSTQIVGSLTNEGRVVLQSSTTDSSSLRFLLSSSIVGNGSLKLAATDQVQNASVVSEAQTFTNGSGHTIHGSGLINGLIQNNGDILANDPGGVSLILSGSIRQSESGRIGAIGDTLIFRSGTSVTGGSLFTENDGELLALATLTLEDVSNNGTLNIPGQSRSVQLSGTMNNNGSININSNQGTDHAEVRISSDTTIGGDGRIHLQSTGNFIRRAQVAVESGATLTLGDGQVLDGSGFVEVEPGGQIAIHGSLIGTDPNTPLVANGEFTGSGRFWAKGGRLEVHGLFPFDGEFFADDGVLMLNLNREDIEHDPITEFVFDTTESGVIELAGAGNFEQPISGFHNRGHMRIRASAYSLTFLDTFVNDGILTLDPDSFSSFSGRMYFGGNAVIDGTGEVRIIGDSSSPAGLWTRPDSSLTIGEEQTVSGGGIINGRIINNGLIRSTEGEYMRLSGDYGGSTGVFKAESGSSLHLYGQEMTGLRFESSGNGFIESRNSVTILRDITSSARFAVQGGRVLTLAGEFVNNGRIEMRTLVQDGTAVVRLVEDVFISGSGFIEFGGTAPVPDSQFIAMEGAFVTIGPDQDLFGSGMILGDVLLNGSLRPAGELRYFEVDDFEFGDTGRLTIEISGTNNNEFGRIVCIGSLVVDGTLEVTIDNGYSPNLGDSWKIIAGGQIFGGFSSYEFPETDSPLAYRVFKYSDYWSLALTCKADLSGDFRADLADLFLFVQMYEQGDLAVDFNSNGTLNFLDIHTFLQELSSCP